MANDEHGVDDAHRVEITVSTTIWCHAKGCDNLIRNDEDFLGTPADNRTHVQVDGVPFCMECYDDRHPSGPNVAGVPVREEDVSVVIGGWPTAQERCAGDSE